MYHILGSGFEKLCQLLDSTNVGLADAPLDLTISGRNTTLGSILQHDCLPPPVLHTVPPFPDSVSCDIPPPPAHSKICVPPGFPSSEPTTAPLTANLQTISCSTADPANTFAVSLQDAFPESSIPDLRRDLRSTPQEFRNDCIWYFMSVGEVDKAKEVVLLLDNHDEL